MVRSVVNKTELSPIDCAVHKAKINFSDGSEKGVNARVWFL